jgi:signal transduction histidine kinase
LAEQFQLISQGNYGLQVPILSGDELGLLAGSFNQMSSKLKLYSEQTSEQILMLQRTIQRTFASFPHPILIMRDDNQVEYSNPAANKFLKELGYNPEISIIDFLQENMDTIIPAESDYLPENLNEALTFRIGSQERHYLPKIVQLRDPSAPKLGVAVILDDITSMRLVDGIKTNLISTVSHEIKNPLTTMRMAIYLLIEKNVGPLNDRQMELAEMIRDESDRMLETLDGLLELARIDHRDQIIIKDHCMIHSLVKSVIDEHTELAALRSIKLEMEIDERYPEIKADTRIVRHILRNFTSNACKYADPGMVKIKTEPNGSYLRFSVIDEGPGINMDIHDKLFERFWRIPGESQSGTGLGLAIVKQMAESHGGKVGLMSDSGKGSTFWVDIPQK